MDVANWLVNNADRIGTIFCLLIAVVYFVRENDKIKNQFHKELLESVNTLHIKTIEFIQKLNEQITRTNDMHEQLNRSTELFRKELREEMKELSSEIKEIKELKNEVREIQKRMR